jgi:hypothetical protein
MYLRFHIDPGERISDVAAADIAGGVHFGDAEIGFVAAAVRGVVGGWGGGGGIAVVSVGAGGGAGGDGAGVFEFE